MPLPQDYLHPIPSKGLLTLASVLPWCLTVGPNLNQVSLVPTLTGARTRVS